MLKKNIEELSIPERVFQLYWMNTFFFYLGLLKDAPIVLKEIINTEPNSELERWLKVGNMSNYFLAAFATKYEVIIDGLSKILIEAAILYKDIVSEKIVSPFSVLPRMNILYILQRIMRSSYSYEFFKDAIEYAALRIDEQKIDIDLKAYAIFFLNIAYIDLGVEKSFDFLLKKYDDLPIDIALGIKHESKGLKEISSLMKKQDNRIKKMFKHSPSFMHFVDSLYDKPIISSSKQLEQLDLKI